MEKYRDDSDHQHEEGDITVAMSGDKPPLTVVSDFCGPDEVVVVSGFC